MNKTLEQIIKSREDISDYLFHFTKGKSGFNTLFKVLSDGQLKDMNNNGYLCFTEAPLTSLYNMFQIFERYEEPLYAQYGIGIKKEMLYKCGARPVIYGTCDDFKLLPEDLKWRFEEYIPNIKDYTWLREWRLKQKMYVLCKEDIIVITKRKSDKLCLMKDTGEPFDFDGDIDDGELHGEVTGEFMRIYKMVSLEEIRDICFLSKSVLDKLLSNQTFGEKETVSLGGF